MKRMVISITVLMFGLFFTLLSAQEQKKEPAPTMPRPKIGPELVKLSFLAGDFTTETAIPANPAMPEGAKGEGWAKNRWSLDSMFIFIEENSQNSLLGNYKGQGFLTFDRQEKQYVLSMFNNFGDHPVYKGDFKGDTLVLETLVPMPGGSFTQRLCWYSDGKNVKLQIFNEMGKGAVLAIDQTYKPSSSNTNSKTKK
ncbi:MAG: hypothetical protein ACM3YF_02640 [Candidatus Zixiibacteriota bacterium]